MTEREQLIVNESNVVIERMLPRDEALKNTGTQPWPQARVGNRLFVYRHTADSGEAKKFISKQKDPSKFVLGIGLEMGEFSKESGYEDPELKFYNDLVGVWEEVQDIPEVFRDAFGGES